MNKDFSEWYRPAAVDIQPDVLDRRWKAISALSSGATPATVSQLAACFVDVNSTQAQSMVRDAVRTADSTFPAHDAVFELRILAGSTLRVLMENTSRRHIADQAALALITSAFGPRRKESPFPQHIDAARRHIGARA